VSIVPTRVEREVPALSIGLKLPLVDGQHNLYLRIGLHQLSSTITEARAISSLQSNTEVNIEEGTSEDENESFNLGDIQKANLLATAKNMEENNRSEETASSDPFARYKPEESFVWNEKIKGLFDFCQQDSAKVAARQHVEALREPSDLHLPCPPLDRSATKHFKDLVKGQDKVKVAQALAALNMDSKLVNYQGAIKQQVKLAYEMARLLDTDKPSVPELLRVCSSMVSLLYSLDSEVVGDRRESIAFYLNQNVELARGLPMPGEKEALFDKAFVLAAEAEQKKEQILYQQAQPGYSATMDTQRQNTVQRYKPYIFNKRNGQDNGNPRYSGYGRGARKGWQLKSNAMPLHSTGKC
jgi:hypothetical protein